jgi:hypothetical protein
MEFPTNRKGEVWPLRTEKLAEYVQAFRAVDVEAELRKARQWLLDHPDRRKTFKGMAGYLGRWLGTAQDSARPAANGSNSRTQQTAAAAQRFLERGDSNG